MSLAQAIQPVTAHNDRRSFVTADHYLFPMPVYGTVYNIKAALDDEYKNIDHESWFNTTPTGYTIEGNNDGDGFEIELTEIKAV